MGRLVIQVKRGTGMLPADGVRQIFTKVLSRPHPRSLELDELNAAWSFGVGPAGHCGLLQESKDCGHFFRTDAKSGESPVWGDDEIITYENVKEGDSINLLLYDIDEWSANDLLGWNHYPAGQLDWSQKWVTFKNPEEGSGSVLLAINFFYHPLPVPAKGRLVVRVSEGRGVKGKGSNEVAVDPYLEVHVAGGKCHKPGYEPFHCDYLRTEYISETDGSPAWYQDLVFEDVPYKAKITATLMDRDTNPDDSMGSNWPDNLEARTFDEAKEYYFDSPEGSGYVTIQPLYFEPLPTP